MRWLFLITILFWLSKSNAQNNQPKTLFGDVNTNSGYGGPVVKYTHIDNEPTLLLGGYGGWFVNDAILFGLGGYILTTDLAVNEQYRYYPGSEMIYNLGYGGLILEFTIHSKKLIHLSFGSMMGGGGIEQKVINDYSIAESSVDAEYFFVAEPLVNINLNITRFFRIGTGLAYRYTVGSYSRGIKSEDINTLSGNLTFKIGWF